jgi:hypothetical protein
MKTRDIKKLSTPTPRKKHNPAQRVQVIQKLQIRAVECKHHDIQIRQKKSKLKQQTTKQKESSLKKLHRISPPSLSRT